MRLLFIAGGFTPPGGIESFINTLSPVLASRNHNVSLLCWGPKNLTLDEIALSGVKVRRQPFRWACRASLPDLLLLARHGATQVLTHDAIIFTRYRPLGCFGLCVASPGRASIWAPIGRVGRLARRRFGRSSM